jgi:plastocyanin
MTVNGITEDIRIRDSHFDPEIITIRQGTTVTWRNEDPVTHYVVHQAPHTDPQLFSSGAILQGGTFSFTFTSPGRYNYADPQRGGGRSYLIIVEP